MEIPLIGYISGYSIILPFLVGIFTFNRIKTEYKYFVCLLGVGLIIEIYGRFASNIWTFHIWDILEYLVLINIYAKLNFYSKFRMPLLYSIYFVVLFKISLFILEIESFNSFTSNLTILTSVSLIFLTLFSMLKLYKSSSILIYKQFEFWFFLSVAIYFSGSIFISLISLLVPPERLIEIYIIHSYANTSANILFTYSFFLQYKNSKTDSLIN